MKILSNEFYSYDSPEYYRKTLKITELETKMLQKGFGEILKEPYKYTDDEIADMSKILYDKYLDLQMAQGKVDKLEDKDDEDEE